MPVETDGQQRKGDTFLPNTDKSRLQQIPPDKSPFPKRFQERHDFAVDQVEYARPGNEPGLVLIFNQDTFDDVALSRRTGSKIDVNEIITCMGRLGFNVNLDHVYDNKSADEIQVIIKNVCSNDLSQYNSLIVFVLSHGEKYNFMHVRDETVQVDTFWSGFADCKTLANKPKMFIFQACKGESFTTITTADGQQSEEKTPTVKSDLVPEQTFSTDYLRADMLIVYATVEGSVAFRNSTKGTWFIQELCRNFSTFGRRDDVLSLIMRTTKCVCGNYYYYDDKDRTVKKQMPIFVSTLTRKFYLNRNKDRNILIKLINDQQQLRKRLEHLENQVAELLRKQETP